MNDDRDIAKARAHMTVVAVGLVGVLGPQDAAAVLLGAATGVLTTAFGPEMAAEYFRGIADAIESGDDGAPPALHGSA
jgi:hypothetical protein